MSEAASRLAPAERLRVAVHAVDPRRRTALGKIIAEAGHVVVGVNDAAEVVLVDGDTPPGERRPVVTLGGADDDLPGVLSGNADASQIDAAIRAVAAGLVVRLPGTREGGFGAMRETLGHALLTPRELDVLAALAEGLTNKAIARRLDISLHTVKFHVESLFRKLGARTRTEAVAKASERRRDETITL
ncbi:response regulator transcription factor [Bradyrhizobium sp.]|uniref:response regulator transcription factor n=1 Tax=Bradyrhizobium sp. TaxID=376 RepID=UPI0025C20270|nr:response regulator transcription factor [Bradyrhizobium sp.]